MCAGQQTVHKLCQDTRLLIMSTKCRLILKLFFHRQDLVPKKYRTKACRYNWHSAGSLGPGIPKTDCHWTCCALHVQKVTERPTHIGMIGYMHMKRTYDNVYSSFYCLQASSILHINSAQESQAWRRPAGPDVPGLERPLLRVTRPSVRVASDCAVLVAAP